MLKYGSNFKRFYCRRRIKVSALENMKTRLDYSGGTAQIARMNTDKLRSLKKAMTASYQAATAILADGREFKCLINPDKIKNTYDNKILSIPFEDVCLNATKKGKTVEGIVSIDLKAGDIFTWKENGSKWLVYLQRLEETAYFRSEIRKCNKTIEINGKKYYVYVRGPEQLTIEWQKGNLEMFNKENYTLLMYITKNEETLNYFHRFTKIEIDGLPWEVQAVDSIATEGIIEVSLKETYRNTIEKELEEKKEETQPDKKDIYISGAATVYPYEQYQYKIVGYEEGVWEISNNKAKIIGEKDQLIVKIEITTGRSGNFILRYVREGLDAIELPITIKSL